MSFMVRFMGTQLQITTLLKTSASKTHLSFLFEEKANPTYMGMNS